MTKFEDTLSKIGEGVSLSTDERAKMDRVIREYIAMKPLATTHITAPHSYSWFSLAYRPIAAALAVVMVFGSGVSYAAENALPGDALYTVKTYINEPAKVALAGSAEAKAEVQIELAERRIEEAAILASEGRLDEETEAELAVAFETHAAAVAENMVEADKEDDSASTELASRFETRLLAHENVLLEVESESDGAVTHATRLADAIRTATEETLSLGFGNTIAITGVRDTAINAEEEMANAGGAPASVEPVAATMMMTMTVASDTPEPTPEPEARTAKMAANVSAQAPTPSIDAKKVSRMKVAAEKSLKAAQKNLKGAKSLSNEARTQAETDLSLAESLIVDGSQYLEADADYDAFNAFKESLRISGQASVYMKAAPTLEKARSRARTIRANTNTSGDTPTDVTDTDPINATITLPNSDEPAHDSDSSKEPEDERPREQSTSVQGTIKLDLSL